MASLDWASIDNAAPHSTVETPSIASSNGDDCAADLRSHRFEQDARILEKIAELQRERIGRWKVILRILLQNDR